VGKALKAKVDLLKSGVNLESRTGYSVAQLVERATADRLELARMFLHAAEQAKDAKSKSYRSAVSRSYYSMYHAFRAISYFVHGGDDHEEHTKLPSGIPPDFPNHLHWENDLKSARFERNRADYDPYPKNERQFEAAANTLTRQAGDLLPIARAYLRGKGCKI
jgi:uncharacterized protein (UPF0332 family)